MFGTAYFVYVGNSHVRKISFEPLSDILKGLNNHFSQPLIIVLHIWSQIFIFIMKSAPGQVTR